MEKQRLPGRLLGFFALVSVMAWLGGPQLLRAADAAMASEAQVKAAFLFNFAKYVDWPAEAFPNAGQPITIGVMGTDPFGDNLRQIVAGKTIKGHPLVIKYPASVSEISGCQILYVSDSEASQMSGILAKASSASILTVGGGEAFEHGGGIINFVLKKGNVRLEIDLVSAKKSGLMISSRLLAVADVVKGKSN